MSSYPRSGSVAGVEIAVATACGKMNILKEKNCLTALTDVPGRVPELEKTLGAVYQEWREVL